MVLAMSDNLKHDNDDVDRARESGTCKDSIDKLPSSTTSRRSRRYRSGCSRASTGLNYSLKHSQLQWLAQDRK